MARKSKVVVNGRVITGEDYRQAALETLKALGTWVNTDTIISYASAQGWIDRRNRPRKAHSHPMFKIMSTMTGFPGAKVTYRYNSKNILEYKLK